MVCTSNLLFSTAVGHIVCLLIKWVQLHLVMWAVDVERVVDVVLVFILIKYGYRINLCELLTLMMLLLLELLRDRIE